MIEGFVGPADFTIEIVQPAFDQLLLDELMRYVLDLMPADVGKAFSAAGVRRFLEDLRKDVMPETGMGSRVLLAVRWTFGRSTFLAGGAFSISAAGLSTIFSLPTQYKHLPSTFWGLSEAYILGILSENPTQSCAVLILPKRF